MPDADLATAPQTETEKPEPPKEDAWEKDRQRLDQAEATVKKLSARLEGTESQLEEAVTEKNTLIERIEKLEADKAQKKDELVFDPMNPDLVGEAVPQNLAKLKEKLDKTNQRLETLAAKADAYEKQLQAEAVEKQRKANIEEVLGPLDKEFGAKYRTAAEKMANKLVDDGDEEMPKTQMQGYKLLRKCYKKLSEEQKTKETVPTDTGEGGIVGGKKTKTGSRADILAFIRKTGIKNL